MGVQSTESLAGYRMDRGMKRKAGEIGKNMGAEQQEVVAMSM